MTSRSAVLLGSILVASALVACGVDDGQDVAGPPGDAGPPVDTGGVASGLPCDVAAAIGPCVACHGGTPIGGAPMSMLTYERLVAPAPTMPGVSVVALSVTRMQDTVAPMPPGTTPTATAADIATLQAWIAAGTPRGTCTGPTDPYGTPVMCSSGTHWTHGNHESPEMHPGMACNACHSTMRVRTFSIAGTLFPSAHEPDDCNGIGGTGATIDIVGADGRMQTLTANSAGNFYSQSRVTLPFTATVNYQGRSRAMIGPQTSGDCNTCHTETGTSAAPGRIMLP